MDPDWNVEATDHISQIITQATRYVFSLCKQKIRHNVSLGTFTMLWTVSISFDMSVSVCLPIQME